MGRWAQTKQTTYKIYAACPKCKGVDTTADRGLDYGPTMTCLKCHHVFDLSSADVDPRVKEAIETIKHLTRLINDFTSKEEQLELHREEMYARRMERESQRELDRNDKRRG
jgi:Zn ribbon nucleic-acid-binding protein